VCARTSIGTQRKPSLTVNPFAEFTRYLLLSTLPSDSPVTIPLLAELVPDGVKPGTIFLVEFDPESEWLAVASTLLQVTFVQADV
jgi:hypothetical protein